MLVLDRRDQGDRAVHPVQEVQMRPRMLTCAQLEQKVRNRAGGRLSLKENHNVHSQSEVCTVPIQKQWPEVCEHAVRMLARGCCIARCCSALSCRGGWLQGASRSAGRGGARAL